MKYEITQYSICVPLTETQWEKLHRREEHNYKEIHTRLKKVGADKIDYNGHFDRNLFFNVDKLSDVELITNEFLSYLKTPLKEIP